MSLRYNTHLPFLSPPGGEEKESGYKHTQTWKLLGLWSCALHYGIEVR